MDLKRGFKELLISQGYNNIKRTGGLGLIILIIGLIIFSSYFLFFYVKPCEDAQCFVNAMANCERVSWVREDIQASWLYIITGEVGDSEEEICNVEVQLLKIKKGALDSEKIQGEKMNCVFLKGEIKLPEKDLSNCQGKLKEKLQEIIIQRMHSYLLENLGEINEDFFEI